MRTSRLLPALLALLLLTFGATACGDDDDPSVSSPGAGSAITIAGFTFDPDRIEVKAGATVKVTNDHSVPHTWTADDGAWDSGQLSRGDEFEHTFDEAGTFAFHCEIHPAMKGTVVVS